MLNIVNVGRCRDDESCDADPHQREILLFTVAVDRREAAVAAMGIGIKFLGVTAEPDADAVKFLQRVRRIAIAERDEEIVAADMADKIIRLAEFARQKVAERRNGLIAAMEAVDIVERFEIVKIALAQNAGMIALAGDPGNVIGD
jgi:hypothetical protein